MRKQIQTLVRSFGYELVPYPAQDWVRSRDALRKILDKLAINCVLDVGANEGQYASELRSVVGYQGWIISFEPIASTFDVLARVAARDAAWRVFHCALGAEDGESEINVMEGSDFSSFLEPRPETAGWFHESNRVKRKENVRVRRLDSVLNECLAGIENPRIYLKMDTQGWDAKVMQGAAKVMDRLLALQTEVPFISVYTGMKSFSETMSDFTAQGFQVVDFMPVSRDQSGICAVEMDCIMARPKPMEKTFSAVIG